ncbi:MAG: hypothetical protein ACP5GJ_04645, partial [Nanopusillaceae archaeon]
SYYDLDKSIIFESKILSFLDINYYWRKEDKEIDGIIFENNKIVPIEIKYKREIKKEDLKNLEYFMKRYNIEKGFIIYLGENKEINNIKLINYIDIFYYGKDILIK